MALRPEASLPCKAIDGPLRVVFFGSPALAVPTLRALVAAADLAEVVGVVSQPDRPAGRGQRLSPPAVIQAAHELGIPTLQPEKIRSGSFAETFREFRPDVAVVIAYGRILTTEILETPRFGCVNVHASLLPRWRGAGPIQWALLTGDDVTGVSTMWMEEGLDTGPVLLERRLPISDTDTFVSICDIIAHEGSCLLIETLRSLSAGTLIAHPQATAGVTLARLLTREDGRIRWESDARTVWGQVRGLTPSPGAFCSWRGEELKILAAEPIPEEGAFLAFGPGTVISLHEGVTVRCGRGALRLTRLQGPGRKALPWDEFLRGQPLTVGQPLEDLPCPS